jgi:hypothetical protein
MIPNGTTVGQPAIHYMNTLSATHRSETCLLSDTWKVRTHTTKPKRHEKCVNNIQHDA